jgi:hypothetical protein
VLGRKTQHPAIRLRTVLLVSDQKLLFTAVQSIYTLKLNYEAAWKAAAYQAAQPVFCGLRIVSALELSAKEYAAMNLYTHSGGKEFTLFRSKLHLLEAASAARPSTA